MKEKFQDILCNGSIFIRISLYLCFEDSKHLFDKYILVFFSPKWYYCPLTSFFNKEVK